MPTYFTKYKTTGKSILLNYTASLNPIVAPLSVLLPTSFNLG